MTRLMQDWLTRHAERRPEAPAVVLGEETLTYGELDQRSNQLARVLRDGGAKPGDRVCLLVPKAPVAALAILGVLKADCIYVPLDPAGPASRVAGMIERCEPRFILVSPPGAELLDEMRLDGLAAGSVGIGSLGAGPAATRARRPAFGLADLLSYPAGPLDSQSAPSDCAYMLFTSGSTGTPKGVPIAHASVVRFVEWAVRYLGIEASERMSAHSPLHFDLSVLDLFGALAAGAACHMVPPAVNFPPRALAEWIRASQLTQWFSVPSVLTYLAKFDAVKHGDFPTLRRLLWGGEVLPTPTLIHWMERLPHVRFTNLYGPTEATVASSYHTVARCPDDPSAPIPIGRACEGEELLVLDGALRPVPPGEIGDLYIRGVGLSPGYWREPERTAAVFVPDPDPRYPDGRIYRTGDLARVGADGLFYFHGRSDAQIKSRGYRIELGEVEAGLEALGVLRECAVVGLPTESFEGTAICCAFVPLPGQDVTAVQLKSALARRLPAYMVPSRWARVDALPRNANGKVDRIGVRQVFTR
jgi:amino acid adenylation domain-containing protein